MKDNTINDVNQQLTGLLMASGVITIIFGITALVWPGITLGSLAIITAIWLFLGGIVGAMKSLFMRDRYEHWFLQLILSLVQFGVGAFLVQNPKITVATFMLLIGINFIAEGIVEIALAFSQNAKTGGARTLAIAVGLLTVAGGIIIWRYPIQGSLAFIWVFGLLALVIGTTQLWTAIDLRNQSAD